jgi:hypothetical protein
MRRQSPPNTKVDVWSSGSPPARPCLFELRNIRDIGNVPGRYTKRGGRRSGEHVNRRRSSGTYAGERREGRAFWVWQKPPRTCRLKSPIRVKKLAVAVETVNGTFHYELTLDNGERKGAGSRSTTEEDEAKASFASASEVTPSDIKLFEVPAGYNLPSL